ncbi:MAG: phosphoribosyltransferase [Nitrospirae bacterium]|nr:phosphoribosyltransferase [Nitrospirota bacterium]
MARLIEDITLRDKIHVFDDRAEAGKRLSVILYEYKWKNLIILAVPAGGVPVAHEIAKSFGALLDLIIVRKVQIPGNPEAGFGAVGPDGEVVFNEILMNRLGLTDEEVKEQVEKTKRIVEARNQIYRSGRPFPDLQNKDVIIVDDGLASGYTMYEAVRFIKRRDASKVIVAVPTAPQRTVNMLLSEVDELYCLNIRRTSFFAVADAYRNWFDLSDEEAISILQERSY